MSPGHGLRAFDATGPLPAGVTLLEASAGTGKTHTIASLVVRYVAEAGLPLRRLLVVTFTRMATGELRERVRERLLAADHALRLARAGAHVAADEVLEHLVAADADELARRAERVGRALADFDAATIATTHGFAQQVLGGLGTAGDLARDAELMEDTGDILDEIVDDLYLARFRDAAGGPPFPRDTARDIARAAVGNRDAVLEPTDAEAGGVPAARVAFARDVRVASAARMRAMGVLGYDDLLTLLRDTLADGTTGAAARARLRERYEVALIDEFQDTDPVQWDIVRRAFADRTLVLIGDPKQAIYSFRGADVHTYLRAGADAGTRATLTTNWRSDQALLEGCAALFGDATLGHPDIPFRPVRAADPSRAPGLAGSHDDTPLRFRVARTDSGLITVTGTGFAQVGSARELIARDVAAEAVRLLSSDATVRSAGGAPEPVHPGHVAVLVRTNNHAAMVRDALEAVGVPAVINGAGSVFATRAATDWLALLRAVERPSSPRLAAGAALGMLLGWSPERLADAGDRDLEELHAHLHRLGGVLRRRGIAALLASITAGEDLSARILGGPDGERNMTDLRHVGQLLQEAARQGRLGVSALVVWLAERVADAGRDTSHEDRSRRLESDARAVQVLTIHRAKGLEFPVVYCPYLWNEVWIPDDAIPVFHADDAARTRSIDVGGDDDPGFSGRHAAHVAEQRGEELRLAYVAITRARHQVVVWWARGYGSHDSALGHLLFPGCDRVPPDDDAVAVMRGLADEPGRIGVAPVDEPPGRRWARPATPAAHLDTPAWRRDVDRAWRRHSFSSTIAGTEEERVGSEPEHAPRADEPIAPAPGETSGDDALRSIRLPLGDLPGGVALGSLVHGVMERCDFTAPDLVGDLTAAIAEEGARWDVAVGDPVALARALADAVATPLIRGVRLADLAPTDRLDELPFELPLAGGEVPTGTVSPPTIAGLLDRHLPPDDPLAAYTQRLRGPGLVEALRGYLTGAIDLVARLPGGEYAVIDYKTNRLAPGPLTAFDYRPEAMAAEMVRAHYPLQALVYLVALHRYLRWRLPAYDPARHLGGTGYLFMRGMIGAATPDTPTGRCGVMWWRPPPALVPELSDLFDRGAAA